MAAEHLSGSIVLAVSATGMVFGAGEAGPFSFPLADLGWAFVFVMAGSIARLGLDARELRDEAKRRGAPMPPAGIDLASLGYSMLAAPMMGAFALGSMRGLGFVPDNMAVMVLMGFGYLGRDGLDWTIQLARDIVNRKVGK